MIILRDEDLVGGIGQGVGGTGFNKELRDDFIIAEDFNEVRGFFLDTEEFRDILRFNLPEELDGEVFGVEGLSEGIGGEPGIDIGLMELFKSETEGGFNILSLLCLECIEECFPVEGTEEVG